MLVRSQLPAFVAALVAALCGVLVANGESGLAFGGLLGAVALVVIAYRPELGALLFLCLVSALPHSVLFDRGIPVFGGGLKVTDLILVATLGSWVARAAVRRGEIRLPSGATVALVLLGIGFAVVSILVAYGKPPQLALFELRPLLSYLLIFPIVSGVRSLREAEVGLALYLAAASIACLITIWRYAHGEGDTASYTNGAIRIIDSVLLISAMLAAIWVAVLLPTTRRPLAIMALSALAMLSLAALFFTFQRTAWVALLAALLLLILRFTRGMRLRLAVRALPVLVIALVVVLAVNATASRSVGDPLHSALTRLTSVADFNKDVSGRYRIDEWKAAGAAIEHHPLAGIGLGNTITFWSPMYSPTTHMNGGMTTTWYIHNSYIWFALKLGVAGAAVFVALLLLQVRRARMALKDALDIRRRRLLLGALGTLVALLLVSLAGPHLNGDSSTPYIAAAIALIEIVLLVPEGRVGSSDSEWEVSV